MSNSRIAPPIVEFVGVEKTYDGLTNVVERLDLQIHKGEFLTLLGPSGSGKTTTLMMLAGFEEPTAGEIILNGKSLRNVPPYRRNIGVVFQNYALFPHKTVAQNVAYPLQQRRLPKAEIRSRTTAALDMVELSGFGARKPNQLSGGQQQRVALARALVFEPDLVLMDEPLGALDKKLREQMQLEIKHLHETLAMTVVYVTHDQGEALTMSDRVAIFHAGVIQQVGRPRDVYERPASTFVANFVGENNNLNGTVQSIDGDTCTVLLDSGHPVAALAVNVDAIGTATRLSVRPERVVLGPQHGQGVNSLPAQIVEVIYSGDHYALRVLLPDELMLVVRAPLTPEVEKLRPGDTLEVGWNYAHCRALLPE